MARAPSPSGLAAHSASSAAGSGIEAPIDDDGDHARHPQALRRRQRERHSPAHRVPDHRVAPSAARRHHGAGLIDPHRAPRAQGTGRSAGEGRAAEARLVGHDDAVPRGERLGHDPPGAPSGRAGSRAVQEEHRRPCPELVHVDGGAGDVDDEAVRGDGGLGHADQAGTGVRSSTAMNARDHSGMSGQPRQETMLPSTTSGASTTVAPAFSMSPVSGGNAAVLRPCSSP